MFPFASGFVSVWVPIFDPHRNDHGQLSHMGTSSFTSLVVSPMVIPR